MESVSKNVNGTVKFDKRRGNVNRERNPTISNNLREGTSSSSKVNSDVNMNENKSSASVVDEEGYQLVQKRKRSVNIVGSKRTKSN